VEHPKFEGHVTPNEDEYQKFVRKNLDVVLKYQNSPLLFLITCILAEEIAFEIGHFRTFWTSVTLTLTLDWVIWYTVVYQSSISTFTPNFVQIGKTWTITEEGFY